MELVCGRRLQSGAPLGCKSDNLSMPDVLAVTSAYVHLPARRPWGREELQGNPTALLDSQLRKTTVQQCWSFKLEKKYLTTITKKKTFDRILTVVFLVKTKSSSNEISLREVIFVVFSTAISVGTSLEFAALGSSPDAKYSRGSAFYFFFFFCPQAWFLRRSEHIFSGKTPCLS